MNEENNLIQASEFDTLLPFIKELRMPKLFVEIHLPMNFRADKEKVLSYFGDDARLNFESGRKYMILSGTMKDKNVFDYLYKKYNENNTTNKRR